MSALPNTGTPLERGRPPAEDTFLDVPWAPVDRQPERPPETPLATIRPGRRWHTVSRQLVPVELVPMEHGGEHVELVPAVPVPHSAPTSDFPVDPRPSNRLAAEPWNVRPV